MVGKKFQKHSNRLWSDHRPKLDGHFNNGTSGVSGDRIYRHDSQRLSGANAAGLYETHALAPNNYRAKMICRRVV